MKKSSLILWLPLIVFGCTENAKEKDKVADNRIVLRTGTLNTVKLTDTMVIYESTCRGCAYEASTSFGISDSMHIIKLEGIVTADNSAPDMNGGSISKDLVLVPVKTGTTNIKVYKFWKPEKVASDSALYTTYQIEVKQ